MMKRKLILLFFILGSVSGLYAQNQNGTGGQADSSTLHLSLRQAQDYAVEHNRTLQNASLSIRQAEASRWASIATMLPQVNGNLNYSNYLGYQMDIGGMSIAMPPYGTIGIGVNMAISGAQIVSAQLGTISMKMADVSLKQTEQDIAEQVKMLYISALVSMQTQELLEKNLETLENLHQLTQKSVNVGVAEQVDADQIEVQIATLETSINSSKRALEMVYNSLRLQLNLDFDVQLVLTETLEDLLDVEKSLRLLYEDFMIDNNFSYQLAKQNTELSRKKMQLSGWAYGPTLSGMYQYNAKKYFSDEMTMNMTPPNMVGVTLTVPIFSSGRNLETLRTSKLEYKKQQNALADVEMSLYIQHSQFKYNLTSAYERFETQKKSVDVSQSVFDNISKKFEFGYSSAFDVTTSATNLISAQSAYVQAALDFVKAQVELEKMLNKSYYE